MALANYSDLSTAVARWTDRDDITGDQDTFIALFETTFNLNNRMQQMLAEADLTYSAGSYALPADFIAIRDIHITGLPNQSLSPFPPGATDLIYPQDGPYSQFFSISGNEIIITPNSQQLLTIRYYQKLPTLSAGNPTNWLMTLAPNAYLFGTLIEAYMVNQEEDRAGLWRARYNEVMTLLSGTDSDTRWSGARMRRRGINP
jgi:hypothetical protein